MKIRSLQGCGLKLFRLMAQVSCAAMLVGTAACTERPAGIKAIEQRITSHLVAPTPVGSTPRDPIRLNEGFGPALTKAVAANAGYRAAVALEAEATSRIGVAESVRRPQLSATATVGSVRETGGSATAGAAGGVNISQLIYDAGESTAAINRATAEALIARAERAVLANDLALEAARAWIDAWQYEERLGLLRSRTAEMSVLVEQIERMASNGILTKRMSTLHCARLSTFVLKKAAFKQNWQKHECALGVTLAMSRHA